MKNFYILIVVLIILAERGFAWPWSSPIGQLDGAISYEWLNSDTKFSDGTKLITDRGEKGPIFNESTGSLKSRSLILGLRYTPIKNIQISFNTSVTQQNWNLDFEPKKRTGIGDLHLGLKYRIPIIFPLSISYFLSIPTGHHQEDANNISLGEGVIVHNPSLSLGYKVTTSHLFVLNGGIKIPEIEKRDEGEIIKGISWPGSIMYLYRYQKLDYQLHYHWLYSGNTIDTFGKRTSIPGQAYQILKVVLGYKISPLRGYIGTSYPIWGIEIPTGFRFQTGLNFNFKI